MPRTLFTLFGLPVTAYALGMTLALLLAAGAWLLHARRQGIPARAAEAFLLLALPLGLLLARLAYVLIRLPFFIGRGDLLALRFWQGGATLWGALAGFFLAGLLAAKANRLAAGKLLDAAAPAGLLLLALGRLCEGLAGQGFGEEAPPQLSFFPLAVQNQWGEWRWAVFLLAGCAALAFVWLVARTRGLRLGGRALLALMLVCASQIFFESFREDEFLRWGFVRAGQLVPALILFGLLLWGLRHRPGLWPWPRHQAIAGFALLILVITACEFALDKTTLSSLLIYGLMLLSVLGLFHLTRRVALGAPRA